MSVAALERKLKLANPEDSCKMVIQACGSNDFPFVKAALGCPSFFFFMYGCLFEVLSMIVPLNIFQCALLEHLNMPPS